MELDELAMRLNNLEQARAAELRDAEIQDFMNSYGNRFSNNRGLGVAILDELQRQGQDVSAADEAVQAILDELRNECTALLELIKVQQDEQKQQSKAVEEAINEVQDKIDGIDKTVQKETSSIPEGAPIEGLAEGLTPPEEQSMSPAPEMPMEQPPAEPAPEMPMGQPPAEQAPMPDMTQPPAEAAAPEQQPLPPNQIPSDVRMKIIKKLGAHKPVEGNKISSNILSACQGGF